jgi:hypothetical protein
MKQHTSPEAAVALLNSRWDWCFRWLYMQKHERKNVVRAYALVSGREEKVSLLGHVQWKVFRRMLRKINQLLSKHDYQFSVVHHHQ